MSPVCWCCAPVVGKRKDLQELCRLAAAHRRTRNGRQGKEKRTRAWEADRVRRTLDTKATISESSSRKQQLQRNGSPTSIHSSCLPIDPVSRPLEALERDQLSCSRKSSVANLNVIQSARLRAGSDFRARGPILLVCGVQQKMIWRGGASAWQSAPCEGQMGHQNGAGRAHPQQTENRDIVEPLPGLLLKKSKSASA